LKILPFPFGVQPVAVGVWPLESVESWRLYLNRRFVSVGGLVVLELVLHMHGRQLAVEGKKENINYSQIILLNNFACKKKIGFYNYFAGLGV
jgi:hypothetical protein